MYHFRVEALTIVKTVALIALLLNQGHAICSSDPDIKIDTLANGPVVLSMDYTQSWGASFAKVMNFKDPLSHDFLYQWISDLNLSKTFSMLATIDSATSQVTWVTAERDTGLGCTDVAYNVLQGEEYGVVHFNTKVKMLRDFKGNSVDSTLCLLSANRIFLRQLGSDS